MKSVATHYQRRWFTAHPLKLGHLRTPIKILLHAIFCSRSFLHIVALRWHEVLCGAHADPGSDHPCGTKGARCAGFGPDRFQWYLDLGIPEDRLRLRHHETSELSHYSSATADVEFLFPWGWDELEGVANRGEFDLQAHAAASGEKLEYYDQSTNERYVPHVIEPAAGATRTMMAFLLAAYHEDEVGGEARTVLRLHPRLAPYQVGVLPLSKKDTLEPLAREVLTSLQPHFLCDYDTTQSIGKRYRRQDEVGTPWCVTVDFDSLEDRAVTVRDRDTTEQVRVPIDSLVAELRRRLDAS